MEWSYLSKCLKSYYKHASYDAIHLYDGPPDFEPDEDIQMIAFTSPNHGWLHSRRKDPAHRKLFMPLWTLQELLEAKEALGLNEPFDTTLREAFGKFGGVARYCLGSDDLRKQGLKDIENALGEITSFRQIESCFRNQQKLENIRHRLLHYIVDDSDLSDGTLCFGSRWIAAKLEQQLDNVRKHEQIDWIRRLKTVGEAGSLRRWLFEQFVHEKFLRGGKFRLKRLTDTQASALETRVLHIRNKGYQKLWTLSSLEQAFADSYLMLTAKNFESLDSFYYSRHEKVVYLFQITISRVHSVNAAGCTRC
jgi:hypothetical protein